MNNFFFLMILAEFIASSSQMLLKKSAEKSYASVIKEYLNVFVIAGYSLLVVSMVISILCYHRLGYMGTVVMEPISYVIVMFMARAFFKEKLTARKLIGMVLIVCGIALFYMH